MVSRDRDGPHVMFYESLCLIINNLLCYFDNQGEIEDTILLSPIKRLSKSVIECDKTALNKFPQILDANII